MKQEIEKAIENEERELQVKELVRVMYHVVGQHSDKHRAGLMRLSKELAGCAIEKQHEFYGEQVHCLLTALCP